MARGLQIRASGDIYGIVIAHELWHMWDLEMGNYKGGKVERATAKNPRGRCSIKN